MDNTNEMLKMLSEDNKKIIQEAIEQKLNEAKAALREEVETEIREEFARRYDHDRGLLVEAMDRMLTDTIREELTEFQIDRKEVKRQRETLDKAIKEARKHYRGKMVENMNVLNDFVVKHLSEEMSEFSNDRKAIDAQRVKLSKQIVESKNAYRKKMAEHLKTVQEFVLRQLKEEISEFAQDRRLLQEQRIKMAKQLKENRMEYSKQLKDRVSVLEGFVLKQLGEEIHEFNEDKKALVESRVKLVAESKKKLEETRSQFVKRAAKLVEGTIADTLRSEITQFRDDIVAARKNDFGRRMFEAFAAEYMSSHLSEGSEVKKLQREIEARDQKLNEAMKQVNTSKKALLEARQRIQKAEDATVRTKILNECLKPLARDKRVVMEELLENVRTDNIQEAFNKYLPSVLGETVSTASRKEGRKKLAETSVPARSVAVTGNRNNRLAEAVVAEQKNENANEAELIQLKKMAGI